MIITNIGYMRFERPGFQGPSLFAGLAFAALLTGCGRGSSVEPTRPPKAAQAASSTSNVEGRAADNSKGKSTKQDLHRRSKPEPGSQQAIDTSPSPVARATHGPKRQIDELRAAAGGIRKLSSKRLTLFTDLPASPEVDELPTAFDQAFPVWCEYFDVRPTDHDDWHMRGFLMKERARFDEAGLTLRGREFVNGFTAGHEFWMNHQTSDYYQRHLLLHEGTHGFMLTVLGDLGPPWYCEGMAELLATHSWAHGKLTMNRFPKSPGDVPRLGRIEMIQKDFAGGQAKKLTGVFGYDARAHQQNEAYGWCWAATALLDGHPRYRQRFRELTPLVNRRDFNELMAERFRSDWAALLEEWQVYVANIEHGYDFDRSAIDFTSGTLLTGNAQLQVASDRGWQNSGVKLTADATYRLTASGRFQVADEPRPWLSEAGGVSIRYVQGRPLGILLAAVRPDNETPDENSAFLKPITVGVGAELTPAKTGTLYLKINDSAGELYDNTGTLTVEVVETQSANAQ